MDAITAVVRMPNLLSGDERAEIEATAVVAVVAVEASAMHKYFTALLRFCQG